MIPYLPYQRKRFFDFCFKKFYFSHTSPVRRGPNSASGGKFAEKEGKTMRLTDMADELYAAPACSALPGGVRVATARHDGVTVTRVEIAREGLERPRGRPPPRGGCRAAAGGSRPPW